MKAIFSSRRNKMPHNNEGKENAEGSFFSKKSKEPFFNVAKGGVAQTKLAVGQPGDKYEKEADTMADAVVNNGTKPNIQNKELSSIQRESLATPQEDEKLGTAEQRIEEDKLVQEKPEIQRMEAPEEEMVSKMEAPEEKDGMISKMEQPEEENEGMVSKMGAEEAPKEEDEGAVQAKSTTTNNQMASKGLSSKIKNKAGNGRKMSNGIQAEMESSFGKDFNNVSIHTDQDAVAMNKELGAQAFTHGKDVYFNSGKYNPDSTEGKRLLAHELTHVVQQNNSIKKKDQSSQTKNQSNIEVELGFNAFIPNSLNAPIYKYSQAWKKEPSPFSTKLFASDNRDYSQEGTSRISQRGVAKFTGTDLQNRTSKKDVGESHQADPIYSTVGDQEKITGIKKVVSKTAPDKGEVSIKNDGEYKGFSLRGEASYPFSNVAPDIDFNIDALVKIVQKNNQYYAFVLFSGSRNDFPAYEAYVKINGKKQFVYTYQVGKDDGPGLINLNSSTDIFTAKMFKI